MSINKISTETLSRYSCLPINYYSKIIQQQSKLRRCQTFFFGIFPMLNEKNERNEKKRKKQKKNEKSGNVKNVKEISMTTTKKWETNEQN